MHTSYLGNYQYCFGSILTLLTHDIMEGRPGDNLQRVWNVIQNHYKDERIGTKLSTFFIAEKIACQKTCSKFYTYIVSDIRIRMSEKCACKISKILVDMHICVRGEKCR